MTPKEYQALFPHHRLIVKYVQSRGEYWTAVTETDEGADSSFTAKGETAELATALLAAMHRDRAIATIENLRAAIANWQALVDSVSKGLEK